MSRDKRVVKLMEKYPDLKYQAGLNFLTKAKPAAQEKRDQGDQRPFADIWIEEAEKLIEEKRAELKNKTFGVRYSSRAEMMTHNFGVIYGGTEK